MASAVAEIAVTSSGIDASMAAIAGGTDRRVSISKCADSECSENSKDEIVELTSTDICLLTGAGVTAAGMTGAGS